MEYIAFDAHKHYTLASVARPDGRLVREQRLPHERGALQQFLARCEPGSPVAVETIGNWYWIVDEIEAAGCLPKLVHARKAKLMMGEINKTRSPRLHWGPPGALSRRVLKDMGPRVGVPTLGLRGIGSGGVRKRNVSIDYICRMPCVLRVAGE